MLDLTAARPKTDVDGFGTVEDFAKGGGAEDVNDFLKEGTEDFDGDGLLASLLLESVD